MAIYSFSLGNRAELDRQRTVTLENSVRDAIAPMYTVWNGVFIEESV